MQAGTIKSAIRAVVPREIRNSMRSPTKALTWLWYGARFKFGLNEKLAISERDCLFCHPWAYKAALSAHFGNRSPEQSAEFSQFLSHCHPGMFLFDIGANFGLFSLACARMGGKAVAIDPSPFATKMIANQLRLNKLGDAVQVLEVAVGETEGTVEMLSSGIYSDGYYRYEPGRAHKDLKRVQVTTIDHLSDDLGQPSHLKIDVEGYEGAVIRGSRNLLTRSSPTIFLELHNEMVRKSGADVAFCVNELLNFGYQIYSVHGTPLSVRESLAPEICRILARRGSS
jgi:FkbM family methyltransferase